MRNVDAFTRITLPLSGKLATLLFFAPLLAHSSEVDFNRDIRPILSDKCFFCHGPDSHERKAGLRLDTAEGALADLGGYSAIVPGNTDESEFVARILSADEDNQMPPPDSHKSLTQKEIDLLVTWVEAGAEYELPWAYQFPKPIDAPAVEDSNWPANWVDQFVLARLEENKITPSPAAEDITLIRRIYFDLTGLPPSPEEVRAFLEDDRDREVIWSELVDRLMNSHHFAERLAVYWLDLVRYADTVGYHGDQTHNISPYRDYVIRAFHENMPFDQFTREQLAGDLLPTPDKWQKTASGYNRLLQTSHEGGIQAKEYNAIYAADRVRNLSAVWMGATVGCAQCHDHKYDPITIKDHYSLASFFADIHDAGFSGNSLPASRPPEMLFLQDWDEQALEEVQEKLNTIISPADTKDLIRWEAESAKLEKKLADSKSPEKLTKEQARLTDVKNAIARTLPAENRPQWESLEAERKKIESRGRKTMITEAKAPRVTRILPRGDWQDDSGEAVLPAVPAFLGSITPNGETPLTRLDLADWLVDAKSGVGGLTARVFANRFWYLFLGTGISRSLDDFGGQGEAPANPELLDQLAISFYENDWDIKALVKTIVTSRTYRQSSLPRPEIDDSDPYNQFVARQSRFRLSAEFIRDNALAVSGLLHEESGNQAAQYGGTSIKPFQPEGYYRHLNFPTRKYQHDSDSNQWRRGVYVHWQRMFLHPMMKAMDAPSREECTAQRPRSNTPNAALVLLNDPTFIEAACALSVRILEEADESTRDRIETLYQTVLSRSATENEVNALTRLYQTTRAEYDSSPETADELLSIGQWKSTSEYPAVELASWVSLSRALLNVSETVTRN